MVDHFTAGVRPSSQVALHQLPGELGRPLGEMTWTSMGGGRQADEEAQAALSFRCLSPMGGIGPDRKGHRTAMLFFGSG